VDVQIGPRTKVATHPRFQATADNILDFNRNHASVRTDVSNINNSTESFLMNSNGIKLIGLISTFYRWQSLQILNRPPVTSNTNLLQICEKQLAVKRTAYSRAVL